MMETRASKRRKSTSNVQFHQDIIASILLKLPVKSLLRFRSVSKPWRALISSSEFVKTHLRTFANDKEYNHHRVILKDMNCNLTDCSLRSLLNNPITEASEIDYPMQDFNIRWCDTANGLICLAGTYKYDEPIKIDEKWPSPAVNLCIWNPSIRKWKILPRFTSRRFCVLSVRYGFGYDEVNDDYKIVVMFDDKRSSNEISVKIYSLKRDSWRTVRGFQGSSWIDRSTKSVKGKLYWSSSLSGHEYNIVSFDLANERWDKLEQPDYGEGKFDLTLGVLGSDLVVVCNYERNHSELWVMNGYGVEASWKKMFTIRCPDDPVNYDCEYYPHSSRAISPPFCQSYNGELLLLYHSNFKIYNPKNESIRQAEVTDLKYCLEAKFFVESLVNPLAIADQGHDNNED